MKSAKFKGLGVALVTPFLQDGTIDFSNLERLVHNLIAHGADYLLALGTNSESPAMSGEEKRDVVKAIVSATAGRVPIVMGVGGYNTQQIIADFNSLDFNDIDAILSVTPYYNKPSQKGLLEHYRVLNHYAPRPVLLYNVPSRTSCNLEAETTLRIAEECSNVIGIKEASGNMNQIMKIMKHKPADFMVISGDDAITLPLLAVGIDGVISVVANAYPTEMAQLVHLGMEHRFKEAQSYHYQILDIIQACFKEGSPAGIKAFLAIQGKMEYYLRLPLHRVSEELQKYIKELAER
ncbi:MAG: 4-hydroxy-tetrahydrodipicolinate synthase [Bacteroidales bacterium]|jgi:4-hydroxy-tetrahydrodipicolinate synthase|nr:4-hydroxy-tetrahydrodipicolinate synthase [Bacteroidales bacterium]